MATVDEPSPSADNEVAELERQLAAMKAKKAASTTSNVSSSDDWMAAYKSNKL